jgi:hypothetical protein
LQSPKSKWEEKLRVVEICGYRRRNPSRLVASEVLLKKEQTALDKSALLHIVRNKWEDLQMFSSHFWDNQSESDFLPEINGDENFSLKRPCDEPTGSVDAFEWECCALSDFIWGFHINESTA